MTRYNPACFQIDRRFELLRWLAALFGIVLTGLVAVVPYLLLADLGHLRDRLTVLISDSLGR